MLSLPANSKYSSAPDNQIWHSERNGQYTVKSGYKLATKLQGVASSSSQSSDVQFWKMLWAASVPNKIKVFEWKLANEWIPFKLSLQPHHVPVQAACPFCNLMPESVLHSLWSCKRLRPVRAACTMTQKMMWTEKMSIIELMANCASALSREEFELMLIVLWKVWFERNQSIQGLKRVIYEDIVPWATDYMLQIKTLKAAPAKQAAGTTEWQPPPAGRIKINVEGGVDGTKGIDGGGPVFRDTEGAILVSVAVPLKSAFSAAMAEAQAMIIGLQKAAELKLQRIILETDALLIANDILPKKPPSRELGFLISDIIELTKNLNSCKVVYVSRSANKLAHSMGKLALQMDSQRTWIASAPGLVDDFCNSTL